METTQDGHTPAPAKGPQKGGRPPGTPNKFSVKAREWAEAAGELPHEFLCRVARGDIIQQWQKDPATNLFHKTEIAPTLEERIDCAKAAAPYFAPKFGTIEFQKTLTDGELDELLALYAATPSEATPGAGEAPPGDGSSGAQETLPPVQRSRRRLNLSTG